MATPLDFLASLRAHQEALAAPLRAQIAGPFHHLSQSLSSPLSSRPFEMYYNNHQDNHQDLHHDNQTSPGADSHNYSDDNDSDTFAPDVTDRLQIDMTTEDSSDVCRDDDATANISADQEEDEEETSSGAYENFGKFAEALSSLEQRRVADFQFPPHHRLQQTAPILMPNQESNDETRFSDGATNGFSPLISLFALGDATEKNSKAADYSRFLMKYSSYTECGMAQCRAEGARDHFHCRHSEVCAVSPLSKKEQITRHLKWHQKRSDSLSHGFLRFSSTDDCSTQFPECSHNRKQTHYHCLQPNCDKVYISTSDVQMHSNYHRKDSAIIQEGFQRFRATEECNAEYCIFYRQRTTHFHCRRSNCQYTFKNKADMEKHKSYHIKDELLNRDGFKKFLKTEECNYKDCKFSRNCNHIHCIRENCNYVLHSSGQLFSHKRKHERKDQEMSYRRNHLPDVDLPAELFSSSLLYGQRPTAQSLGKVVLSTGTEISVMPTDLSMNSRTAEHAVAPLPDISIRACPISPAHANPEDGIAASVIKRSDSTNNVPSETFSTFLQRYITDRCASNDNPSPPAQAQNGTNGILDCYFSRAVKHVHCLVPDCPAQRFQQIIPKTFEDIIKHFKFHFDVDDSDLDQSLGDRNHKSEENPTSADMVNPGQDGSDQNSCSIGEFFNRKRGRPPKNRFFEVYNSALNSPQGYFTSFKLEQNSSRTERKFDSNDKTPLAQSVPECNLNEANNEEDEAYRVSVVRSSGIFYPQKSDNKNSTEDSSDLCRSSCKLKKKTHFHCEICNQAFTDKSKLQLHELRHKTMSITPVESNQENKISHPLIDLLKPADVKEEILDMSPRRVSPSHPILSANLASTAAEPEDLSKKLEPKKETLPAPISEPDVDGPPLDPSVVNFLHFQRIQMFFQNYYQQLMGQQMLMHPNPAMPELPPGLQFPDPLIANQLLDSKSTKRPLIESEGQDILQNFKKIKLEKFYDQSLNRSDLSKSLNGDSPIINPNLMDYPPNFPMMPNFLKQDLPTLPVRMPCTTKQNRIFKDEPVPKGYLKFKFNEDCNFMNCGYRNHQSHFHCIRNDCCYSFCDKTRFVQHSARHERLDKLMGGDFKQFRANMSCDYPDCEYNKNIGPNNKSSHFHCLSCTFVCSDTNKVVAHRRQHNKMNQIKSAGFEKFTPGMDCSRVIGAGEGNEEGGSSSNRTDGGCVHNQKQTHYHCLVCNYAVLGLAQMSAHKFRHME